MLKNIALQCKNMLINTSDETRDWKIPSNQYPFRLTIKEVELDHREKNNIILSSLTYH